MEKYLKILLVVFACVALALIGVIAGFRMFAKPQAAQKELPVANHAGAVAASMAVPSPDLTIRIGPETMMVYEYVYTQDGTTEVSEEKAPYFLLNMDREKLVSLFSDWEILSFSKDKVMMRKEIEGRSVQHYIVGIQDGFVSVFYQNPVNGVRLKEMTDKPVSALSQDERERLENGVLVVGEAELIRVMEDFSS